MKELPRLRKSGIRRPITIVVDKEIEELYRIAKQNGWNPSEIFRQACTEKMLAVAEQIKRPAS